MLGPARRFGTPVADLVAPMSYGARQTMLDEAQRRAWAAPLLALGFHRTNFGRTDRSHGGGRRRASVRRRMRCSFSIVHGAVTRVPEVGNGVRRTPCAVGFRCHRAMERGIGKRHSHRLGTRALGSVGAASSRQRLYQPHCRRRPARESAGLVRRKPSAAARNQDGVRQAKSVSGEFEHSACLTPSACRQATCQYFHLLLIISSP